MTLDHWLAAHEQNFGSKFERLFAVEVLAKVDGLDLGQVDTQYPFTDLDGRTRYCDFVIREHGLQIALEVDGYDKKNTGQGMSHEDFVDWQRRQAALTAQSWYVLRFANRDVVNEPERCRRYVELLLREQRSRSSYQASLEEAIEQLNTQIRAAQGQPRAADRAHALQGEIDLLRKQLQVAQDARPLSSADESELQQLHAQNAHLRREHERIQQEKQRADARSSLLLVQNQGLRKEGSIMKTTLWAFTAVIAVLVAAGAYLFTSRQEQANVAAVPLVHETAPAPPLPAPAAPAAAAAPAPPPPARAPAPQKTVASASCYAPIDWRQARQHDGQRVALRGVVAEYRPMPQGKGAPTWINIGAKYPNRNRVSAVVWGADRDRFGRALSEGLVGREVCVLGTVHVREGVPQLSLKWPSQLRFQ
ncbi:hypothetical protein DFR36_107116 [Melaminivora alkalimesophila]|uniref:DUF559 domain-containing protein n=2 Tax=Melaminivora alkalimesophila TaxID=1165852 RepID=A0A317RBQ5_9BURK|nr:hypothetical protein [Melaminivora alkalimesophila]PWW44649.1 hypothetical protein DFR36_107116 [Melaminivora alkalimesophila]